MTSALTIDLWLAPEPPQLAANRESEWQALLSAEEAERWQRFAREQDRSRYLLSRALCRTVLAEYVSIAPNELQFSQNNWGKPQLVPAGLAAKVPGFNISHTNGMVALAVCMGSEVGVDVENITRKLELMALAQRYFSRAECLSLQAREGESQREYFFALWTLKEAWLKAKGLGLRVPLKDFTFSLQDEGGDSGSIELHCEEHLQDAGANWQFWQLREQDFRLALASPVATSIELVVRHGLPGRDFVRLR